MSKHLIGDFLAVTRFPFHKWISYFLMVLMRLG